MAIEPEDRVLLTDAAVLLRPRFVLEQLEEAPEGDWPLSPDAHTNPATPGGHDLRGWTHASVELTLEYHARSGRHVACAATFLAPGRVWLSLL